MIVQAKLEDKEIVVDILANSFRDNKSVNYIIKQDKKRLRFCPAFFSGVVERQQFYEPLL